MESFSLLNGEIINEMAQPIPFAHIKVKQSIKGTISNIHGRFSLEVKPLDAIMVSCLGYKPKAFYIPRQIPDAFSYTLVLRKDTITLAETIITPWPGTYHKLKEAIKKMEFKDTIKFESKDNFIIDLQKKAEYASLGADGMPAMIAPGPFSIFHNAFGDKPKQLRKLKKDKERVNEETIIKEKFNATVITQLTGMQKKKQVGSFIKYCDFSIEYLLETSKYEIALEIQKRYAAYIKMKKRNQQRN